MLKHWSTIFFLEGKELANHLEGLLRRYRLVRHVDEEGVDVGDGLHSGILPFFLLRNCYAWKDNNFLSEKFTPNDIFLVKSSLFVESITIFGACNR